MSHHEYQSSRAIERLDFPFYGLIMTAMRQADTENALKLRTVFPDVWRELQERYNAPGGFLKGEEIA